MPNRKKSPLKCRVRSQQSPQSTTSQTKALRGRLLRPNHLFLYHTSPLSSETVWGRGAGKPAFSHLSSHGAASSWEILFKIAPSFFLYLETIFLLASVTSLGFDSTNSISWLEALASTLLSRWESSFSVLHTCPNNAGLTASTFLPVQLPL